MDAEVERLRRLRGTALRVRAVALSLGKTESMAQNPLLRRVRCAAWRVARAVSGRLRAHPYVPFQKDATLGVVLGNSLVAMAAACGARAPQRALLSFAAQLRNLAHELDRTRALTWATELSDLFGRSQNEIRSLLAEFDFETQDDRAVVVTPPRANSSVCATTADGDWPYLAL